MERTPSLTALYYVLFKSVTACDSSCFFFCFKYILPPMQSNESVSWRVVNRSGYEMLKLTIVILLLMAWPSVNYAQVFWLLRDLRLTSSAFGGSTPRVSLMSWNEWSGLSICQLELIQMGPIWCHGDSFRTVMNRLPIDLYMQSLTSLWLLKWGMGIIYPTVGQ